MDLRCSLRTALLTFFLLGILPVNAAFAAATSDETGTVTIEQVNVEYLGVKRLGKWGLAMPTGVIEGESENINLKDKPVGNYALTVAPPDGAVTSIEVFEEDVLIETFDSRTAQGKIVSSGGTLRFVVTYEFSLTGDVTVISNPAGLSYILKAPAGVEHRGTTPAHYPESVEGSYTVYFTLPSECRPPMPISRALSPGGRLGFTGEYSCSAFDDSSSSSSQSSQSSSSSSDAQTAEERRAERLAERQGSSSSSTSRSSRTRTTTQSPVRVALSVASPEVTQGGAVRSNIVVLNRGEEDLNDLQVELRYDASTFAVRPPRGAEASNGVIRFTIENLNKGAKWEQAVTGNAKTDAPAGTSIVLSAMVGGDDLSGVRASQRSASTRVSVIGELPQTGFSYVNTLLIIDLLMLIAIVSGFASSIGFIGATEVVRRK